VTVARATGWLGRPLRESDYENLLRQSGIRREWVDQAGILRVDDAQGRQAVGYKGNGDCAGLLIPHFLPGESQPRQYALRRDNPDIEYNADGKPKEKSKYLLPPGTPNILYFCPGTTPEQLADKSLPVLIVEGVKKALACHQTAWDSANETEENLPFVTVAVAGVWNFRGTTGKRLGRTGGHQNEHGLIPDFGRLQLKGRKVIIGYDQNVEFRTDIQFARMTLTKHLRGAKVHWLHWPANVPSSVNGLDDLLGLQGRGRVLDLITSAKPYLEAVVGVRVWSLSELFAARFDPPVPIAEDLLNEGETIAIVGRPKQGKSRLVQQFAVDVSRSRPFLGHKITVPRNVLILDLENRKYSARIRFQKIAGSEPIDNVHVYIPDTLIGNSITMANANGIRQLKQLIEEIQPDVLIIDNWRLFLAGEENKAEPVVRCLAELSGLRSSIPKLAIIIVAHLRKQQTKDYPTKLRLDPSAWVENVSGAYAFVCHTDACFGLEREKDRDTEEELIVFAGVHRSAQPRTLLLQESAETLRFDVEDATAALLIFTPVERTLWDAVKDLDEFRFETVIKTAGTTNRKAVASMLRKAKNNQLVHQADAVYRPKKC
jgi:RecA-family ATPase